MGRKGRFARTAGTSASVEHKQGLFFNYLIAPSTSAIGLSGTVTTSATSYNAAGAVALVPHVGTVSLTQQQFFVYSSKTTAQTAHNVVLRSGIISGGLLVLMVEQGTSSGRTVSGCGATWARAVTVTGASIIVEIWIGRNPTVGQTTVTVTDAAPSTNFRGNLCEFAGCDNSVASWTTNSKSNNVTSSGTTMGTNTVTPAATGDLAVAAVGINQVTDGYPVFTGFSAATVAWSNTGSWTALQGIR